MKYLLLVLLLFSCASQSNNDQQSYEEKYPNLSAKLFNQKVTDDFWSKLNLNLDEKVYSQYNSYFRENIERSWIKINVEKSQISKSQLDYLKSEIDKLPPVLKKMVARKILFWSITKNLTAAGAVVPLHSGGSGYQGGILMDEKSLGIEFCKRVEEKERTIYQEGPFTLGCKTNKPLSAFLGVLIHELGHAIAFSTYSILNDQTMEDDAQMNWHNFSRVSWEVKDKIVAPKESHLELWPKVRKYYTKESSDKRVNELAKNDFLVWNNSSFNSMYAVSNASEDWAEMFSFVILKKYMGINVEYNLKENGKVIMTSTPCEKNKSCWGKYKLAEFMIENPELFPNLI